MAFVAYTTAVDDCFVCDMYDFLMLLFSLVGQIGLLCFFISETAVDEFIALLLVMQAQFLHQLQMEMKVPASSACHCRNVWGKAALIPEHTDRQRNITLLSENGCLMQESSIKSEKPKVDIEVGTRIFVFVVLKFMHILQYILC